jgi:hypothetical protein
LLPEAPWTRNEPFVSVRVQRGRVRFDRFGATQRRPTFRPGRDSSTVNTTREALDSEYLTVEPLAVAATGPPLDNALNVDGETASPLIDAVPPLGPRPRQMTWTWRPELQPANGPFVGGSHRQVRPAAVTAHVELQVAFA